MICERIRNVQLIINFVNRPNTTMDVFSYLPRTSFLRQRRRRLQVVLADGHPEVDAVPVRPGAGGDTQLAGREKAECRDAAALEEKSHYYLKKVFATAKFISSLFLILMKQEINGIVDRKKNSSPQRMGMSAPSWPLQGPTGLHLRPSCTVHPHRGPPGRSRHQSSRIWSGNSK